MSQADPVEQFAERARQFREWVLSGTDTGSVAAQRALRLVSALYAAGLELPQPDRDYPVAEGAGGPSPKEVYSNLAGRLPIQNYGEVLDPLLVPSDGSGIGDVADDIADIFGHVDRGLRWLEAGNSPEAVVEWGYWLPRHWGDHATSAMRAIHCWLATNDPEWLTGQQ